MWPQAKEPSPRRSPAGGVEPVRTCVGCRRRGAPDSFVRLARGAGGAVAVGRHEPGRGAWLCDDSGCFDQAVRQKTLGRALRTELTEEEVIKLRVRLYGAPGGSTA